MNDVLIICADPEVTELIESNLGRNNTVQHSAGLHASPEVLDTQFDLIFIDLISMQTTAVDAFQQTIQKFRLQNPWVQFVALAPQKHTRQAVNAVRQGADDFLTYPFDESEIKLVVDNLQQERTKHFELEYLRDKFWKSDWLDIIYTNNPAMRKILKKIQSVAPTIATVLLLGQTGTGKGLMARLIHRHSHRSEGAFIAVHCGAIPDTLIESELFGHEKGAFTGADRRKIGKFEMARNGTLFLDEIGTISLAAQIKLLQVLQDGTFNRLGNEETLQTNARIIAATNADLEQMAATGAFRKDLFYRLNIFPIQLPQLSERLEDLPHLADVFLNRLNNKYGKNINGLHPGLIDALKAYDWPGNLRELENILERAYILETGNVLRPESFPETLIVGSEIQQAVDRSEELPLSEARQIAIDAFEQTYLEKLLKKHSGKIGSSAKEAHITSRQFSRLASKHGLDKKMYKK
ncbi:Fis family transcriptional regulator [Desulfosarcina widdelii]|uniref:Fis family transcriptional regulator n=1 Tax=Desulfosarcina widdelii TaxID=947919 RepID=A0A5K7Z7A3_9BACT|nr:sigma-54 dependent transcriptional regulator [Desulfosarcina widdelii]BBO75591.1 Fis family transcriptional regulator [Desulfosarcina widdelii]